MNEATMTFHDVASSSATSEWPTPQWLADQLAAEFGPFHLDPCATRDNAKAPVFFTKQMDGLSLPWFGRVFLNNPYRESPQWMAKAACEVDAGRARLVVALVAARPGTRWYEEALERASIARTWPRGAIKWRDGSPNDAPFASATLVFGALTGRHGTRPARCEFCRRVFWPRQANGRTCGGKCKVAWWRERNRLVVESVTA
jgi:phage N-6-adenine-methyltransferase